ncbi:MAG TPA: SH3 domain-containing protein [Saprospiraceae bacterium]|nr:SH3 domain-containing protein [Saprospiraceae bacterium]HMQ85375.1 SH3 domain-containing protein [Saprospiraceae bacterium]
MRLFYFLFAFTLYLLSCQSESSSSAARDESLSSFIQTESASLYQQPGFESEILNELHKDEVVTYLGVESETTDFLQLEGFEMNEPWLKVKTTDGSVGWIYAGVTRLEAYKNHSGSANPLYQLWGKELEAQLQMLENDLEQTSRAEQFRTLYATLIQLQDQVNQVLQQADFDQKNFPSVSSLFQQACPFFQLEWNITENRYIARIDYRYLLPIALQTPEKSDDYLLEVFFSAYPIDSVEYSCPAWRIEDDAYRQYSLLGRGTHQQVIQKLDQVIQADHLFLPAIDRIKQALVNDITAAGVVYWEHPRAIIAELDQLLEGHSAIFSQADKIAIGVRRKQMEAPEQFQLLTDFQSGRYQR